jgi:hypothetical protein
MVVIDKAVHSEIVVGIDADAAVSIAEFERLDDVNVPSAAAQATRASAIEKFNEGLRGTVQNWQFKRIDFDVDVIYSAGIKRGEDVFGRREQHALFHQTGGVADAGDVANVRFDLEVVEVHAPENNPGIGWSRNKPQTAAHSRMQTDAFGFNRTLNCKLV